ncbi:MAG: 50S ribosomal protein L1 [Planctomycetes bacterium]|nr:50S ribosomal protein L1 [Planctomycetota bacterium]
MSNKPSKRYTEALTKVDSEKNYEVDDAIKVLQSFPKAKFDEAVEIAVKLNIDPKQADQAVRGSFSVPNGIGKEIRVVAFVDDSLVDAAKEAGATMAGGKELADKIKNEAWFDFDVVIAEPKMMRVVGQLGRVLGPKGLMPSPKAGTVVPDPVKAIKEFASGRQEYKNDSGGNVHFNIGKVSFDAGKIAENLNAFVKHIQSVKPSGVKGNLIATISLTSTMGPGIRLAV